MHENGIPPHEHRGCDRKEENYAFTDYTSNYASHKQSCNAGLYLCGLYVSNYSQNHTRRVCKYTKCQCFIQIKKKRCEKVSTRGNSLTSARVIPCLQGARQVSVVCIHILGILFRRKEWNMLGSAKN